MRDLDFTPAPRELERDGLLGWVGVDIRGIRIEGFTVRRTATGDTRLFVPERVDRGGRRRRLVEFRDPEERRELERRVIESLRRRGHVP